MDKPKKKTVYLDNCCFNRPYDSQLQEKVHLETEAKLYVQDLIKQNSLDLIWSFMLDFENSANPLAEQKESILEWKYTAKTTVQALDEVRISANKIQLETNLKSKDALHIACAIHAKADFLLTTDTRMLKSKINGILIVNPVEFVFILSEEAL
ncbi:MAG: hypothetical protein A2268_05855 [Candidatus Raymondbacteria bacterium RifOxyA12_full_50_37]|uniref:PIN domain-containing protein n=1 Tax=Candidatus Raymondbacteria bacterium RIFOXYD12_FULL_49_13 TaxID=1817890 RepID=A0A1F7FFP3_UNCRA|nr:MAG: hypothetical protein A2268_05855 [Candidatus Raymondbacteria bacterium RifOxyA12_full_50_37]OGJ94266.1 MAG: hypothetical protein A2248_14785 [Candidatus Raymondbacteria bacterium RIFOXYA2_FULL_49_16]OGJ96379.1 MAG: hypothetical protein A2487_00385 [Candidatus Raymondbacteria bacterium RifOxyC12_full_50_8]OGJ99096.1 MAG: hypothetical protein A2453_11195 [Candidatus Raymondbacteria bacterium RIFOXYC2_FULL_50_21]OGK01194.1 MAG: hypothetical protein A2350_01675 [Candidatus Raymondbacteria b